MLKTLTNSNNQMPLQPGTTRNRKLVSQNASKRNLQSANNTQHPNTAQIQTRNANGPIPSQTIYSEGDPLAVARYNQYLQASAAPNDKNVTEILSQSN